MAEPKIRFKRDDGTDYPDIQQVPFGDVVTPFTEKTKVENEDTLLSCAINGVFLNSELFGHQRGASNKGYKKIRRNTLILSAQNLHLGNANVNQRFDHGIISPAYNTYDIVGCNPDYMAQWVKRDATKKFFYDATTTGASQCRRNVDWNALYEQVFYVPCAEEQQKIVDFLSTVDKVIMASEEELVNLESQKKAVMKMVFSREVRFKTVEGTEFPEWEEVPLGTVARVYDGTHQTPEYVAEGIKFVSVENITDLYGSDKYISEEAFVKQYKNNAPQKGDVLMTRIGDIGTAALVSTDEKLAYYVSLALLKPSNSLSPKYLLQEIESDYFRRELWTRTLHTAYPKKINKEDIGKCMIQIPCLEEQKLIADFLSSFDEVISEAKKELVLWKQLKKGLLQQLFV